MPRAWWIVVVVVLASSATARAQPEVRGAYAFTEWDAGPIPLAGAMIRTRVLFPDEAGPFPLVGVIHGASRTGTQQIETARTFASRGFVVMLPDMPCLSIGGCDHDANANQLVALLDWAVMQSDDPASMLHGRVDGTRRGLVGHSWGALATHLAAARDPRIQSIVLFDPNDDANVGRDATALIAGAEMQLIAAVGGVCNAFWDEAAITPMLSSPKVQLTVSRSGHCDPEDPSDALCPLVCGSGDPATKVYFRRYAVAWTECILTGNPAVADWLDGPEMTADATAAIIENVTSAGLDVLPCRGGIVPDADAGGMPGVDAGGGTDVDAGGAPGMDAGGGPSVDAGTEPPVRDGSEPSGGDASGGSEAGVDAMDAGDRGGPDDEADEGGCGCVVPGARPGDPPLGGSRGIALLTGLVWVLARRRRARCPDSCPGGDAASR